MTRWRTAPIRQDETSRDNDEKEPRAESQPASFDPEPLPEANAEPRSFGGKIKALFRDAMKALTSKSPAPKPKRRRKRGEDTRGLFKKLARKIMAPVVRLVFDVDDFHWSTPPDELDETQRLIQRKRYSHTDVWAQHDHYQDFRHDHSNDLSPHL
jgi:hypothetical protein